MTRLSSKTHAVIDYFMVAFLWCAPVLFFLPATTAIMSYVLGAVHLLLTLSTNFELGVFKLIPFPIHGSIELLVAIVLLVYSFFGGNKDGATATIFLRLIAVFIFLVWLCSDYRVRRRNSY